MSNLLALDQSSRCSGYAVFIDGQLSKYGTFTFDDSNLDLRLVKIRQKVFQLIEDYNIDEVVYEDIQQQDGNVTTYKALAEVFGVISELLEELKMKHSSVFAASWKSTLGIKGRTRPEQKKNAQQYVEKNYNIKTSQDAVDAICIGLHYIIMQNNPNDWTK